MKIFLLALTIWIFSFSTFAGDLKGVWKKPCEDRDGDFISSQITVGESQWAFLYWGYEDSKCESPYIQFDRRFEVFISQGSIDMKVLEAGYTPLTSEVAEALNLSGFCGIHQWEKGKRFSVLSKTCGDVNNYKRDQMLYSIFSKTQSGNKELLWIGEASKDLDGSLPTLRHAVYELYAYERGNDADLQSGFATIDFDSHERP